jgi:class 3 adenylate cyclase
VFRDLVGSTDLSTRLDPEALHALVAEYRTGIADITKTHGGHVAQFLGDGALLFFGYPIAHANDTERAMPSR